MIKWLENNKTLKKETKIIQDDFYKKFFQSETLTKYEVKPTKLEISIKKPEINFQITPKPNQSPVLIINKKQIQLDYSKNTWNANLKKLKANKYAAILNIAHQEHKISITIKGGFTEEKLF